MALRRLTLLLLNALYLTALPAYAEQHSPLTRRLSKALGAAVQFAELSPDGKHAAVMLENDVALTTAAGQVVWKRRLTSVNRYLTDLELPAAAAPGGRLFAVAGGPSFRKVLLLDARGRTLAYFSTRGTPRGLAFDHRGRRLAVGTAGGWLYVLSLASVLQSQTHRFRAFPESAVRRHNLGGYFGGFVFSPDDRLLATTHSGGYAALLTGSGSLLWKRSLDYYADLRPSRDWRWFTLCETPSKGPFFGSVSLLMHTGKKLWSQPYRDPQAAVSPDNRFVLMRTGPASLNDDPNYDTPVEWRVADWKGRELPRNGKGESARFVAPGGLILTVRDMTWTATQNGRMLWTMRTELLDPEAEYRELLGDPDPPEEATPPGPK